MTDIIQRVRTVFEVENSQLVRELDAIRASTEQATKELRQAEHEVDMLMAKTSKPMEFAIKVQSGSTDSGPHNKFVDRELGNLLGDRGEERMADQWMLDELERMRAAATKVKPPLEDAAKAAEDLGKKSIGASKGVDDLRAGVKGAIAPVDGLKGAISLVRENFFVFGTAAFGVYEAISAISKAFSESDEIAAEYAVAVKGLADELARVAKFSRENRIYLGLEKAPTEGQTRLEQISGTPANQFGPGTKGEWQIWNDKASATRASVEDLQRQARDAGFNLTASGNIDRNTTDRMKETSGMTYYRITDPKQEGGNLSERIQNLATEEAVIARLASERAAIEAKNKDEAAKVADEIKKAAIEAGKVSSAFSATVRWAQRMVPGIANVQAEEPYVDTGFRFYKVPPAKNTNVNIDARGSKIQVTTKLETDDPARFADATVKSAFLGAVARPLAAVTSIGGVSSGGR